MYLPVSCIIPACSVYYCVSFLSLFVCLFVFHLFSFTRLVVLFSSSLILFSSLLVLLSTDSFLPFFFSLFFFCSQNYLPSVSCCSPPSYSLFCHSPFFSLILFSVYSFSSAFSHTWPSIYFHLPVIHLLSTYHLPAFLHSLYSWSPPPPSSHAPAMNLPSISSPVFFFVYLSHSVNLCPPLTPFDKASDTVKGGEAAGMDP